METMTSNPLTSGALALFTVDSFQPSQGPELRYGVITPTSAMKEPPLFYVPGLAGSVKNALGLLKPLSYALKRPIVALDGRGFGLNESVQPTVLPQAYLKDFEAFYRAMAAQMEWSSPPVLMGNSLGGVFSTYLATRYPQWFSHVISLAPAYKPHPQLFSPGFKLKNLAQLAVKGPFAKTQLPYSVYELTQNAEHHQAEQFQGPFVLPTFYLFLVETLCLQGFNHCWRLDLPHFIAQPELDCICDPAAMASAYHRTASGQKRLFSIPGAFHDLTLEPPEVVEPLISAICDWLVNAKPSPTDALLSEPSVVALR